MNTDIFYLIGTHLDGYDACSCRLVCQQWKYWADRSDDLVWKRRVHLIMLERIERLEPTIGRPCVSLSITDADTWLENIFWYNYGVNIFDVIPVASLRSSLFSSFIDTVFEQGEGCRGIIQNTLTKELIFINNYYGTHTNRCDSSETDIDKIQTTTYYKCTPVDHIIERIQEINGVYPGLILNWKFIHFPFLPKERFTLKNTVQDFHRGAAFYISINPGQIKDVFSITKYLQKMIRNQPPVFGMTGKGKKRRYVNAFKSLLVYNVLKRTINNVHDIILYKVIHPHWTHPEWQRLGYIRQSQRVMPYDTGTGKPCWKTGQ